MMSKDKYNCEWELKRIEDLLKQANDVILGGVIYEHGNPESRLITATHKQNCEQLCTEHYIEQITEVITEYLDRLYYEAETKISGVE